MAPEQSETTSFVESEEALHEEARAAVGADDFGSDGYLEGLRVLLRAYDREAKLTPLGRTMVRGMLVGILKNRLVAERYWSQQPEILGLEIRRPIFIIGLPRTGTTALHHLLGQDPSNQTLEYWMAANPSPRPPRDAWKDDPRFQQAVEELEAMYAADPSLRAIHLMSADGPEECRHLLMQTFTDDTFDCNATIPSYSEWYAGHDMRDAYERHRDLLKLVGSTSPERRWVLKYPVHMRNLGRVLETYPDACIVQTHRDPTKVVPSLCSLVAGWRAMYEEDTSPKAIAEWQIDLWARGMEQAMRVRREHDSRRFFDLHFREIVADPLAATRRIYAHFGIDLDRPAEGRIRAWHADNPQGKHGQHRYGIEELGLTERSITERYAAYMEHFGIEREAPT